MAAAATSPLGVTARPEQAYEHLRVITFNTAVGNPRIKTAQRAFLELPFYRDVIEGGRRRRSSRSRRSAPSRPWR